MGDRKRKNSSDSDGSSSFDENKVSSDDNEFDEKDETKKEEDASMVIPSAFKLKREPCVCACSSTLPHIFISDYKVSDFV